MKGYYDRSAVSRSFEVGDKVLVLLPITSSVFAAKFSGPYAVKERLCDTDYVLCTPDRKRKTRVCHINMLKRYQQCWSSYFKKVISYSYKLLLPKSN